MKKRLLPAYPLFVNDPYFSIWSDADELNKSDTIFWTGLKRKTYGVVLVGDKAYSFLGIVRGASPLKQTEVNIGAFSTDYTFESDEFVLKVSFVSPLLITDLELMSRPVCYLAYKLIPKKKLKNVKIVLALNQNHCYCKVDDFVIGGAFEHDGFQSAYFGLNRQHPMSQTFDSVAADWGYTYVTAKTAYFAGETTWNNLLESGSLEYVFNKEEEKYIIGVDVYDEVLFETSGKITVAFDDMCSVFYYGEWLKGYYFRNGKTIFDAIKSSYSDFEETMEKLAAFEKDLNRRLEKYDDDYKLICFAALRQSVGAHKLVQNTKGELLFLSKECHSNGCIATVDITYPSMPLFLMYNPQLVQAMVTPIFEFARTPVWRFPFAPHDAGTYPYCLGQVYGLYACAETNTRFISNSMQRCRANGIVVTHPMIYQFPSSAELYKRESQMPLEECSNMLIISYAAIRFGAGIEQAKKNYDLLKQWYKYLKDSGLIPEMQICTDDFIARLDKNVGLSVKAIVAVKCFSLIAELFSEHADAAEAEECFSEYRKQFYDLFENVDVIPLTYDSDGSTFSLKYNMAYDVILGTNIFTEKMREKEIAVYLSRNTHLGVPLDSRSDLTKTDWQMYVCALTDDKEKRKKIYGGIANFLRESPCRVPFSDLYHLETGEIKDFQNRSVQGGVFILLLKDMAVTENRL